MAKPETVAFKTFYIFLFLNASCRQISSGVFLCWFWVWEYLWNSLVAIKNMITLFPLCFPELASIYRHSKQNLLYTQDSKGM